MVGRDGEGGGVGMVRVVGWGWWGRDGEGGGVGMVRVVGWGW